ncbi:hypothetical protein ACQP2U_23280 [Nocardia sp. CA-084685]|uniref:hypothetical protein n=1 Tax=Nocardia sp. CA-084685 TaxID=3239970 RepID=UPI003D977F51
MSYPHPHGGQYPQVPPRTYPAQVPHGYQPPRYPMPRSPKKPKWPWISLGLVVLMVFGVAGVLLVTHANKNGTTSADQGQASVETGPPDRDTQAVMAALRQLDACALLDLNIAKSRGLPDATLIPSGPHSCMMATDGQWQPSSPARLRLSVGTYDDFGLRYNEKPIIVGDMKAYEMRQDSGTSNRNCTVRLPISFTFAIALNVDSDLIKDPNYDACVPAEAYAAGVVTKLSDPDAHAVDAARQPFSAWDGCAFMTKLVGQGADSYRFVPNGAADPLSGCRALSKDPKAAIETGLSLETKYDKSAPGRSEKATQIGGKDATINQGRSTCDVSWNQGETGVTNVWFSSLVFTVRAKDCNSAQQFATQAIHLAGQHPNDNISKPQRPLLYRPDENDTGSVGACVDFTNAGSNAGCAPYRGGVTVPKSFEAAANASRNNQGTQCEAFHDAVKAAYGDALAPVTWAAHCLFVEPTHTFVVMADIDGANRPDNYGKGGGTYSDRQVTQIGGKPAVTFWDAKKSSYDVYYSPYDDIGRAGNLHIKIEAYPARGDLSTNKPITAILDPAKAKLAEQVIAQMVQKYFP